MGNENDKSYRKKYEIIERISALEKEENKKEKDLNDPNSIYNKERKKLAASAIVCGIGVLGGILFGRNFIDTLANGTLTLKSLFMLKFGEALTVVSFNTALIGIAGILANKEDYRICKNFRKNDINRLEEIKKELTNLKNSLEQMDEPNDEYRKVMSK